MNVVRIELDENSQWKLTQSNEWKFIKMLSDSINMSRAHLFRTTVGIGICSILKMYDITIVIQWSGMPGTANPCKDSALPSSTWYVLAYKTFWLQRLQKR